MVNFICYREDYFGYVGFRFVLMLCREIWLKFLGFLYVLFMVNLI